MIFLADLKAVPFLLCGVFDSFEGMNGMILIIEFCLAVMSMYVIAIQVERFLTFLEAKRQTKKLSPKLMRLLDQTCIEEAITVSNQHPKSHVGAVVQAGLKAFHEYRTELHISTESLECTKIAIHRAIKSQQLEFNRGLDPLLAVGFSAPLLGVIGMVNGFFDLFRMGDGDCIDCMLRYYLSHSFSQGVFALGFGTVVSLVAIWTHFGCKSRVDTLMAELDNASFDLMDYLLKLKKVKSGSLV